MKYLSPCHEMFSCINRLDHKEDCEDICDDLALYRDYLDALELSFRSTGEQTFYNLPLAERAEEGATEDAYSSLLAIETIKLAKLAAVQTTIDEAIDTSWGRPLYNNYFGGGCEA